MSLQSVAGCVRCGEHPPDDLDDMEHGEWREYMCSCGYKQRVYEIDFNRGNPGPLVQMSVRRVSDGVWHLVWTGAAAAGRKL